ncbi:hypothetical protein EDB80DRAFT_701206 [Ilyonectria destructans]|nr:hypothetical protein EDB80DRAFT_701206 [Ilyonectria destructans]
MANWTHLIRFVGEDDKIYLGQPVNTTTDVGLAILNGEHLQAAIIEGDAFTGLVTQHRRTVKEILTPLTQRDVGNIWCIGLNYRDHAAEAGLPIPKDPDLFMKPVSTLTGPSPSKIEVPKLAQDGSADYEGELAIIISNTGKDIAESDAMNYVLGYANSNDVTARVQQLAGSQWSWGKGFDTFCPVGPVVVSPNCVNGDDLSIKTYIDDKLMQDSSTSQMIFNIRQIVARLSRGHTLTQGDIILTGTPPGIGWFRKPRVALNHGTSVKVCIENLSTLVNVVDYI